MRIVEYISENLLFNAVDDYISRTKIKARVTPLRMTNDMSFSHYPNRQNRSKAALFKIFCKDDFCDEVRDSKIQEPEAAAPVPVAS